jgi:hypothetical protein
MIKDKALWYFSATLEYPLESLRHILFDFTDHMPGSDPLPFLFRDKTPFEIYKRDNEYEIRFQDHHKEFILVVNELSLIHKGQWWYKGIYTLEAAPNGTNISLQIYNAATNFSWLAGIMVHNKKKEHQEAFEKMISGLREKLNCI